MTKNISVTLDVEDLRPSDQFEDRSKLMTEKVSTSNFAMGEHSEKPRAQNFSIDINNVKRTSQCLTSREDYEDCSDDSYIATTPQKLNERNILQKDEEQFDNGKCESKGFVYFTSKSRIDFLLTNQRNYFRIEI